MAKQRRSHIQSVIREAAEAYAKENRLRGGCAYRIAKISRLPLSSVQGFLSRDSRHMATMEAIAEALGLTIKVEPRATQKVRQTR